MRPAGDEHIRYGRHPGHFLPSADSRHQLQKQRRYWHAIFHLRTQLYQTEVVVLIQTDRLKRQILFRNVLRPDSYQPWPWQGSSYQVAG